MAIAARTHRGRAGKTLGCKPTDQTLARARLQQRLQATLRAFAGSRHALAQRRDQPLQQFCIPGVGRAWRRPDQSFQDSGVGVEILMIPQGTL